MGEPLTDDWLRHVTEWPADLIAREVRAMAKELLEARVRIATLERDLAAARSAAGAEAERERELLRDLYAALQAGECCQAGERYAQRDYTARVLGALQAIEAFDAERERKVKP